MFFQYLYKNWNEGTYWIEVSFKFSVRSQLISSIDLTKFWPKLTFTPLPSYRDEIKGIIQLKSSMEISNFTVQMLILTWEVFSSSLNIVMYSYVTYLYYYLLTRCCTKKEYSCFIFPSHLLQYLVLAIKYFNLKISPFCSSQCWVVQLHVEIIKSRHHPGFH